MVDLPASAVPADPFPERLLTVAEAAAFLDKRPQTLAIWRMKRRGPAFVRLGRAVHYRLADLRAFIERNVVAA